MNQRTNHAWSMPEEGDLHQCTWMAFGASEKIWGTRLIDQVREDLAILAETVAEFEPVRICVRPDERELAKEYFESTSNIEFIACPLNDLWIRDYGAVFVTNRLGEKSAVDFNFNGWGEKQSFAQDAMVA
ncbi:MAG: agmatine deiminase family protein, partial [Planctomycetota bacterium]